MGEYLRKLFRIRIVRYALVGGIGIPINLAALAVFLSVMGDRLYPLALACSFEVSTTINFVLNQLFTYREQKHLHGWDWVKRALKAQMTSFSAQLLTYGIALFFKYEIHISPYLASTIGIIVAFFFNFAISKRFVFRPAATPLSKHGTDITNMYSASAMFSNTSAGYGQNDHGENTEYATIRDASGS